MTKPERTVSGGWHYGFWTSAPWPFYRAGITLPERDAERAERYFHEWVEDLRRHLRGERG